MSGEKHLEKCTTKSCTAVVTKLSHLAKHKYTNTQIHKYKKTQMQVENAAPPPLSIWQLAGRIIPHSSGISLSANVIRKPSPVSPMSSEKPYLQLTHWIFWDRLSSPQFLKAKTLACETSEPACFTESKSVTSCDKSSDTSVAQKREKREERSPCGELKSSCQSETEAQIQMS